MDSLSKSERSKARVEQITSEFFAKTLQIILETRIPSISSQKHYDSFIALPSAEPRKRDRWFNLVLGNSPIPRPSVASWRSHPQGLMVIDVLLSQGAGDYIGKGTCHSSPPTRSSLSPIDSAGSWPTAQGEAGKILLERWFVQFKSTGAGEVPKLRSDIPRTDCAGLPLLPNISVDENESKRAEAIGDKLDRGAVQVRYLPHLSPHAMEVPVVYKKTILMLRSVYAMARLLPAYRLFRLSCSSPRDCNFKLSYRLSTSNIPQVEEAEMSNFCFTPVDTCWGQMLIKVDYHTATSVTALEVSTSTSPHIIADYVGGPTTERVKKLSDEPLVGSVPSGGLSGRKIHVVCLPSSVPSVEPGPIHGMHHWWKGGLDNVQLALQPPSPSMSLGGSLLSHSFVDDSQMSSSSQMSEGSFDSKPAQNRLNRNVSAPIPIVQNRQFRGSHFLHAGGSPLSPYNMDNLQMSSPSEFSLPALDRTFDSRIAHYQEKININPVVHHHHRQTSAFHTVGGSRSSYTNLNYFDLISLAKKPGHFHGKSIVAPIPVVQHAQSQLSHLNPTGKSSSSRTLMHFGSAPVHACTGFTVPNQAALRSQGTNHGLPTPEDNIAEAVRSTSRTANIRRPYFVLESMDKKATEHEKDNDIENDPSAFPFAIDDDECEQKSVVPPLFVASIGLEGHGFVFGRIRSKKDGRTPTCKPEVTYHRTQVGAVGELIRMLQSASPLQQMGNNVTKRPEERVNDPVSGGATHKRVSGSISGKATANSVRTATDALENLRAYKEMRDFLLRQSGRK
eukprot:Gb_20559 [translate_table: standard]